MNRKNVFLSLPLAAALAAALGLSSCAAPAQRAGEAGSGPAGSATTAPASQESAAASAASSAPAATPTSSAASPSASATPTASAVAGVKMFTFPDGHLSFSYPSNWSIRTVGSAENASKLQGVQAVIADSTGNEVASIVSSTNGSSASGPVARTVLDAAPVPGLKDVDGEQLAFGFAFDSFADQSDFHMSVRKERDFAPSVSNSGSAYISFANGGAEAKVLFGSPAFASVDSAKAWMITEQYSQLKRLLLSLKYS
ncbi:hypothetical protein ACFVTM_22750 [Arthrobacter sp. NPDC058130]|uniref:hypothetical protein n=1 Tax=Arthrobacter sp. NPDC058130 TaxID=3346353 RepID=UPI0036E885E6